VPEGIATLLLHQLEIPLYHLPCVMAIVFFANNVILLSDQAFKLLTFIFLYCLRKCHSKNLATSSWSTRSIRRICDAGIAGGGHYLVVGGAGRRIARKFREDVVLESLVGAVRCSGELLAGLATYSRIVTGIESVSGKPTDGF
jgi:hypothetical protein